MKIETIAVEYSEHMGSDRSVVNAARQSFAKQKTVLDRSDEGLIAFLATGKRTQDWEVFLDEISGMGMLCQCGDPAKRSDRRAELKQRLIEYKREAQHWAPFGHPHVTLRLRMPIFLARQFVKHQVGGVWSEESRRYMDDEVGFYIEPVFLGRPSDVKQGASGEVEDQEGARILAISSSADARHVYKTMLGMGVAPEQAREQLTLNAMTGVTWTGSLLFWSRVCNQRLDPHAQSAARALAAQIDAIMAPLFPLSWKALVH